MTQPPRKRNYCDDLEMSRGDITAKIKRLYHNDLEKSREDSQ